MRRTRLWASSVFLLLLACGLTISACGDTESEGISETQLERAKEEGERVAHERARIDELENELRNLKRAARRSKADSPPAVVATAPDPAPESESELLRTFHSPSGNVSCAITSTGAFCTVVSIAATFRFEDGGSGQIDLGSALPRAFGELAGYGSTISAGSVTCTVPEADESRGIACVDVSSGHGFEASRVDSRQKAY